MNSVVDYSESSKNNKEALAIQILQALIFQDLKDNTK
jgi:hypothetical protein